MNILLINKNPIVSRLITLCLRDDDVLFEELEDIPEVEQSNYNIVFVDSDSYTSNVEEFLHYIETDVNVFLLPLESTLVYDEEIFSHTIKKPFLPSQIREIIDTSFKISSVTKSHKKPEILNIDEIDKIKSLLIENEISNEIPLLENRNYESRKVEVIKEHLEADGLEIIVENDIVDIISKKTKSKKSKRKKDNKKLSILEDKIIETLKDMKPKKIKKLLKGAEIHINIKFKDSK